MPRYEFCTYFDVNYLVRGLVLYRSLSRVCESFRLHVFCMDDETSAFLATLDLPNVEIVPLAVLEAHDRELAAVKPTRDQIEYCWTATPCICLYVLEQHPDISEVTYLDADLMFFADPGELWEEMGLASVLLTPHRYAPQHGHLESANGVYNVQFMTFKRTPEGLTALRWWRDRCIEWCYRRHEDGKFGDQKYLDDWPERFDGVHVLEHPGGGLAPWNASRYALTAEATGIAVDGRPLVFHHFHGLSLHSPPPASATAGPTLLSWEADYPIGRAERRLLWEPYAAALQEELALLRSLDHAFTAGVATAPRPSKRTPRGGALRASLAQAGRRIRSLVP